MSTLWTRQSKRGREEGMIKQSKRKEEMEVKEEGMGREMSEKRMESTGRREGLESRRRKGIYSQERHVRLHEKELFIQEPQFSHEFPKTQASVYHCSFHPIPLDPLLLSLLPNSSPTASP